MASLKPISIGKRGTSLVTALYRVTGATTADQISIGDSGAPSTDVPDFEKVIAAVAISPTDNSTPTMVIDANGIQITFGSGGFSAKAALYIQVVGWAIKGT